MVVCAVDIVSRLSSCQYRGVCVMEASYTAPSLREVVHCGVAGMESSGSGLGGVNLVRTAIRAEAAFGGEWLMMAGSSTGDDAWRCRC